ncbi:MULTISPECIES: ATP-binding protein [unclassified Janthinobacterium]|uniref:ATP-binding protein n=1 Tax=unclassified Janthinobacterium TaxID=2610881 RepID=UPI00034A2E98|nr:MULTISPECIES: ATP-binding protein [unclassified Janthinobacterium]MEC5163674.1 two-component system NtrC family sensor kinase [Janthinobacterium sp. CG_S6]
MSKLNDTPHPPPAEPPAAPASIALSEFFDGHPVATFAIDTDHVITHWNKACEHLLGWNTAEMVGARSKHGLAFYARERPMLSDLIVDADSVALARHQRSAVIPGAYEAEDFFPNIGEGGHWLHFTAAPLRDGDGNIVGAIETMRDVTERRVAENALRRAHDNLGHIVEKRTAQLAEANERLEDDIRQREVADAELRRRNLELTELNDKLSMTQQQLLQSEKLASIGQLAAGVAHEINNPIGYIFSNFGTLQGYLDSLFAMLRAYQDAEASVAAPALAMALRTMREQIDLDFLREDIPVLMGESKEGIVRVRHIVQDLKDFSRVDASQEWVWANLHHGIDSTLNIVSNEVKYKADVVKEYADIPDIECLPSQINQVVMNLVVNAAHAIGERRGTITVRTGCDDASVWLEVADNGAGIARENLSRIFDPFFTTKAIGKGTGLGLSLSYGIVQKHEGRIEVDSEPGRGTTFRITLPIRHAEQQGKDPHS